MDVLFEHGLPALGLWSVEGAPSEGNTFGALLFWTYIAAALYLLYDLTRTILALKKISRIIGYGYSPVYVATFSLLCILSLASASWNMLNVLATSYQQWAERSGVPYPQQLYGDSSLLGPKRTELHLWQWSVQSTPFRDFAQELTTDSARYTWALSSLGITCVVACWMGMVGRIGKPLPKLWTFFALLQILPTSVTLNFFILALLFTPKSTPKQFILRSPGIWIASGLGYYFLVVEAATERMQPYLILVILGARLLLLVPFFVGITWVEPTDPILEKVSPLQLFDLPLAFSALAVWSVLHQAYFAVQDFGLEPTWDAKSAHPAVSTLAFDAIQSVITIIAWVLSSSYARPAAHRRPIEEDVKEPQRKKKGGRAKQG